MAYLEFKRGRGTRGLWQSGIVWRLGLLGRQARAGGLKYSLVRVLLKAAVSAVMLGDMQGNQLCASGREGINGAAA